MLCNIFTLIFLKQLPPHIFAFYDGCRITVSAYSCIIYLCVSCFVPRKCNLSLVMCILVLLDRCYAHMSIYIFSEICDTVYLSWLRFILHLHLQWSDQVLFLHSWSVAKAAAECFFPHRLNSIV